MSIAVSFSEPDHYGQAHPRETPELLADKMRAFDAALVDIPLFEKENLIQAQTTCPELLTPDFKLQFLRCEVFHEDLAAKRYIKYWDKRVSIFGPEKAFQPLTLQGSLKEDLTTFDHQVLRLLVDPSTGETVKDPSGRSIVFLNPAVDRSKYDNDSMIRIYWYTFHAALEDVETQQKGIIFIAYPAKAKFSHFNRPLAKEVTASIKGCLPIRMSAFHVCQPPTFFKVIFPILKLFLGERLRKRIRVHSGSDQRVQEDFAKLGITKDKIPSQLGGSLVLDHKKWLDDRTAKGL